MIIAVGGIKGGTGKTTLATNLVVERSKMGRKVLLVDADEQKSSIDWTNFRTKESSWVTISLSGSLIHDQIKKLKRDYDDIIIDNGSRDTTSQRSALVIADKVLIPFQPRCLDIWTIEMVIRLIKEIKVVNEKLKPYVVFNRADSRGSDNETAVEIISKYQDLTCLPVFIKNRKIYNNAMADGLGVSEMPQKDHKALDEIKKLHDLIYA